MNVRVVLSAMCFRSSRLWQSGVGERAKQKKASMVCLHTRMPGVTSHPEPIGLISWWTFLLSFSDHYSRRAFVNSDTGVALSLHSNSFWRCSIGLSLCRPVTFFHTKPHYLCLYEPSQAGVISELIPQCWKHEMVQRPQYPGTLRVHLIGTKGMWWKTAPNLKPSLTPKYGSPGTRQTHSRPLEGGRGRSDNSLHCSRIQWWFALNSWHENQLCAPGSQHNELLWGPHEM